MLSIEEFELFLVQGWVIWNQRNSIFHGGHIQDPAKLNQRAKDLLEDFRNAQDLLAIRKITGGGSATWRLPSGLVYDRIAKNYFVSDSSIGIVHIQGTKLNQEITQGDYEMLLIRKL